MERINDTLYGLINTHTQEWQTFTKVTTWADGTPMDDSKTDGTIYRKKGTEYFKLNFTDAVNVKWFGVKGDGITDDLNNINHTINTAGKIGAVTINFPDGVYLVSNTIVVNYNIVLNLGNATIKNTKTTNPQWQTETTLCHEVIRFRPNNPVLTAANLNPLPSISTITTAYKDGNGIITVTDASQINPGDYIQIKSTEPLTASRQYYNKQYITKVLSKSGNDLTIEAIPLDFKLYSDDIIPDQIWQSFQPNNNKNYWAWRQYEIVTPSDGSQSFIDLGATENTKETRFYASADSTAGVFDAGSVRVVSNINVYKPLFLKNVGVTGGTIDGGLSNTAASGIMKIRALSFYNCIGANVANTKFTNYTWYGAYFEDSIQCFADHLNITETGAFNPTTGCWGVYLKSCQQFIVTNCFIKTLFSGVDCSMSYIGLISNNICHNAAIDPHSGLYIKIIGNKIYNGYISVRARHSTIMNNDVNNANDYTVSNRCIDISEAGQEGDVIIAGNTLQWQYKENEVTYLTPLRYGIYCQASNASPGKLSKKTFERITIIDNDIRNCDGIIFNAAIQYNQISNDLNCQRNNVYGYYSYGFLIGKVSRQNIKHNNVYFLDEYKNGDSGTVTDSGTPVGTPPPNLATVAPPPDTPYFALINNSTANVWFLNENTDPTVLSNWKDLRRVPRGITITGDAVLKNNDVYVLENNVDGIARLVYNIDTNVTNLYFNSPINNPNASATVNGANYSKAQAFLLPTLPATP